MTDTDADGGKQPGARAHYHHGNLRDALVDAAIALIAAHGVEGLSLREAAKFAGVSAGAPFRHFPSRLALLNAIAEQAQDRLGLEIDHALATADGKTALEQFRAIGHAFLHWAVRNPTHFQVISDRSIITYDSPSLRGRNDRIRERMRALISQAAEQGLLRPGDLAGYEIGARALAYGLARMYVDGQFPSWGLAQSEPLDACIAIFDQFITSISA